MSIDQTNGGVVLGSASRTPPSDVGAKGSRLFMLLKGGYHVPPFVTISASDLLYATREGIEAEKFSALAEQVRGMLLGTKRFAVRSAALCEDDDRSSQAGQFRTVLDVPPDDLSQAITEVCIQARDKLGGTLERFSLIIQEFIDPDYAGVLFTRDPLGRRESVIEWHSGTGEHVVSGGEVLHAAYLRDRPPALPAFPECEALMCAGLAIERDAGHPQDIEWAVRGRVLYLLQTRPISTLSKDSVRSLEILESLLPDTEEFFYERTALAETFAHPTPLALDLLRKLHMTNGPVERAYRRFGARVSSRDTFKLFNGQLYVDSELSAKQFFPAYSYFGAKDGVAHPASASGWVRTLQNMFAFAKLPTDDKTMHALCFELESAMSAIEALPPPRFADALMLFEKHYEIIFAINLLSGRAWESFTRASVANGLVGLLPYAPSNDPLLLRIRALSAPRGKFSGNSLDIADEHPFLCGEHVTTPLSDPIAVSSVAAWHKEYVAKLSRRTFLWNALRERGRWLTVVLMDKMRSAALALAHEQHISDPRLIYFANMEELIVPKLNEQILRERKNKYSAQTHADFPERIASFPLMKKLSVYGVSPGVASGIVVRESTKLLSDTPCILFAERLAPEIAELFPKLKGIVAKEGGVLSHLAILAREFGIPVVVDPDAYRRVEAGERVTVDGNKGVVVTMVT